MRELNEPYMKIGIVPFYNKLNKNKLFDIQDKAYNVDNALLPYSEIKNLFSQSNIEVNTLDCYNIEEVDAVLFFTLDYTCLKKCLKNKVKKIIYFAWEPEVVDRNHSKEGLKKLEPYFHTIMTWNDDLVDNIKYFKINYPHHLILSENECTERDFNNKKLLVNISGNKKSDHPSELYSERVKVIDFYNNKGGNDFELYGSIWPESYIHSKGKCLSKYNVYNNFKFALCLENMCNINGYVTEKILDCFVCGVVPVYWGATNISSYIPDDCYINYKNFTSLEDMHTYLVSMNYATYQKYVSAITAFLKSKDVRPFTSDFFVENVQNAINSNITINYPYYSVFFNKLEYVFKTKFKKMALGKKES